MLDTFHAMSNRIRQEQAIGAGAIFQQGNAHPRIAQISQELFWDNQRDVLPWSASISDLCSTERVWHHMQKECDSPRTYRQTIPAPACSGYRIAQNCPGRY